MNSDNWVVQNLVNALNTWNEKLAEIWMIITQSPEQFKGGGILSVHFVTFLIPPNAMTAVATITIAPTM